MVETIVGLVAAIRDEQRKTYGMNECRKEICPFRSNSSSSVYRCEHIACPNRDDGSVVFITADHTIIQKEELKDGMGD